MLNPINSATHLDPSVAAAQANAQQVAETQSRSTGKSNTTSGSSALPRDVVSLSRSSETESQEATQAPSQTDTDGSSADGQEASLVASASTQRQAALAYSQNSGSTEA